jgi:hypothetical protein
MPKAAKKLRRVMTHDQWVARVMVERSVKKPTVCDPGGGTSLRPFARPRWWWWMPNRSSGHLSQTAGAGHHRSGRSVPRNKLTCHIASFGSAGDAFDISAVLRSTKVQPQLDEAACRAKLVGPYGKSPSAYPGSSTSEFPRRLPPQNCRSTRILANDLFKICMLFRKSYGRTPQTPYVRECSSA